MKPVDARHRAMIEAYSRSAESPLQILRPKPQQERAYRVDVSGGLHMPQASRSTLSKLMEFVLGV